MKDSNTRKSFVLTPTSDTPLNETQTKQDPIDGTQVKVVSRNITVRSIDRSSKDAATWMSGIKQAESVINPNRVRLYDVYEMALLDGHLSGIIDKRIDTVLNKRLLFKKGEVPVPEMEKVINSKAFRDVITEILLAKIWGISGLEFIPGKKLSFRRIPRKHIKPKWQIITLEQNATEGISYTDLANVWIVGESDDLGLLMKCSYYALMKKGVVGDWAEYIEMFGSPVIVTTYDATDTQTDLELDKALEEAGNGLRLKIPKQAGFAMHDGKASNGDGKLQLTFSEYMDRQMSIVILGNTDTTTSSKGSGYAQSKTHSDQQLQITKRDMVDVADNINSDHFLKILESYGYPVDGGNFEYDKEIDFNYLAARIEVDKELYKMGLPYSKDSLYETYAVDQPKEGDILEGPTEQPAGDSAHGTEPPKPGKKSAAKKKPEDLGDEKPATLGDLKAFLNDFFGQAR